MRQLYLLLLFLSTSFSAALAQKGRFDVRFLTKSIDCAANNAVIQLQVRANRADSTFLMGDANFRFDYNPQAINNPGILTQVNFSNASPASDANYAAQSLNGSTAGTTKGTVSLNVFYSGGNNSAKPVGTDWLTVSEITFRIVDADKCFDLQWHTDKTFPITGLSEIIHTQQHTPSGYESRAVAASGVFEGLQLQSLTELCNGNPDQSGRELFIPDGFSPNGDGVNDLFVITNLGGLKASVSVFDQNGSVLFRSDDYKNNWNGSYNNQPLPAGTYFYAVQLSDGRRFTKGLTLSR